MQWPDLGGLASYGEDRYILFPGRCNVFQVVMAVKKLTVIFTLLATVSALSKYSQIPMDDKH